MTENGIEYNLNITPYTIEKIYNEKYKVLYKFSSKLYLTKFENYLNSEEIKNKLDKKALFLFGRDIDLSLIYDLNKYQKLEKRGYHIIFNDKVVKESENIDIFFNFAIK